MPVVGQAIVTVRVRSNALRNDIRDAVNDGFRGADRDIDARGKEVGAHFNDSIAKGMRQDERVRIAAERLNLAIAKSLRDDQRLRMAAEQQGLRVTESIARGMRDEEKLRQSSDRLSETIRNNIERGLREDRRIELAAQRLAHSTQESVDRALRDNRRLDLAGEREANRIIEGMQRGMRDDRKLALAADSLAERTQARLDRAFGDSERLRIAGERMNQQIADGVRRDRSLELAIQREARMAAGTMEREHRRGRPHLINLFGKTGKDLAQKLGDEFNFGIGRAKMGPVVRAMLFAAAPSLINGAAALGVAAAGALTAALSSALLSGGLLAAAFASGAESLEAGKNAYSKLGTDLGTLIANSMADGFNASAKILTDRLVPVIEGPLRRAGELFGEMFSGLAETLTTAENLSRIGQILDNNNQFISSFSTGLQGLTTAFLSLWAASKPMIDLVGSKFAEFGTWAANALAAAEANGALAHVMDNLTRLADGMFGWLAKIGPAFGDWLMNLNVEEILDTWSAFGELIASIFAIFGEIIEGAGPQLPDLFRNIAATIRDLVESGVIETFAAAMATLVVSFTGFLDMMADNPIVAQVLAFGVAWLLLGGILSPVVTLLTAVGTALGSMALPIAAVVAAVILMWQNSENLRNAIGDLVAVVVGKFQEIWDDLAPKVETLWEEIQKLAGAIGDRLAPIIEFITPIIESWLDVLGSIIGYIVEQLGNLVGFFADLFTGDFEGAWEHAKDIISTFWNFIKDIFTKLRLFIGSIFSSFWDLIVGVWDSVWGKVSDIASVWWNNLWELAKTVFTAIVDFFKERYDEIVDGLIEMRDGFVAWWDNLLRWVSKKAYDVWEWIKGVFVGAYEAITGGIRTFGNWIHEIWLGIYNWLIETAKAGWEWIKGVFTAAVDWVLTTIRDFGNWIHEIWLGIYNWLLETAASTWEWIKGVFIGAVEGVLTTIRDFGNWIHEIWLGIYNWLLDRARDAWEWIKGVFTKAVDDIVKELQNWGSTIANIWNSILAKAREIWDSIWAKIEEVVNNIVSWVKGAFDGLVGAVRAIWDRVYDAIVQPVIDAYNAVVDWVGKIKGKISEAITAAAEAQYTPDPNVGAQGFFLGTPAALAAGGTVMRPTMALIGEAGPERVEPLDSRGLSNRDRALISAIVGSMMGGKAAGGSTLVKVSIGEREITDFITEQVMAASDAQARRYLQRRRG